MSSNASQQPAANQPRMGAFAVMVVILLGVFALVSRMGGPASPAVTPEKVEEFKRSVAAEAQHISSIIGAGSASIAAAVSADNTRKPAGASVAKPEAAPASAAKPEATPVTPQDGPAVKPVVPPRPVGGESKLAEGLAVKPPTVQKNGSEPAKPDMPDVAYKTAKSGLSSDSDSAAERKQRLEEVRKALAEMAQKGDADSKDAKEAFAADNSTKHSKAKGVAYKMRKEDTLWSIAKATYGDGNRWKDIVAANPGLSPKNMADGKEIILPELGKDEGETSTSAVKSSKDGKIANPGASTADADKGGTSDAGSTKAVTKDKKQLAKKDDAKASASKKEYVVRPGETLADIAKRCKVAKNQIKRGDGASISDPNRIYEGEVLSIGPTETKY